MKIKKVHSFLLALVACIFCLGLTACNDSNDRHNDKNPEKATIDVIVGVANSKVLAPADAVKYGIALVDSEGAVLDGIGFAAKGGTDEEFTKEYTVSGQNRVMSFETDELSATQMRIACFDKSDKYLGSGFVTGMKLEKGQYYTFDNSLDQSANGFDFVSADKEASQGKLEVTADTASIAVGEKATLKAVYTTANGFVEDVTDDENVEFTSDAECVELNDNEVTGLAEGQAAVTATMTLADSAVLSASVDIQVGERSGGNTFLRLVDGEYQPIKSLIINTDEALDATIAYGKVDANGEATLYSSKFTVKANYGELTGYVTVEPEGQSVETCQVNVNLDKDEESSYIYCEPDDCPGVLCDSLPVIVTSGMDGSGSTYNFLRLVDGKYQVTNALWIHNGEDLDADIAFGTIDENGQAKVYASKFEVRNAYGDDPIDYVTVDPSGVSTENCHVTASASGGEGMPYILCYPDDCPGVLCASLPMGGFTGRGGVSHFLQKGDDGKYTPINYISAHDGITTLVVAYGDVDENGQATLYDTKYWAKDNVEELNGFLTVVPTGTSTKECVVVVNTEKDHNCNFLYCEPDNYPGVICASLPVIVTYGE